MLKRSNISKRWKKVGTEKKRKWYWLSLFKSFLLSKGAKVVRSNFHAPIAAGHPLPSPFPFPFFISPSISPFSLTSHASLFPCPFLYFTLSFPLCPSPLPYPPFPPCSVGFRAGIKLLGFIIYAQRNITPCHPFSWSPFVLALLPTPSSPSSPNVERRKTNAGLFKAGEQKLELNVYKIQSEALQRI